MTAPVLEAFVPVACLLALGWRFAAAGWLDRAFWSGAERLAYWVLTPCLLITALSGAGGDASGSQAGALALAIGLTVGLGFAAVGLWRAVSAVDGPQATSVLQGSLRFNAYIALAISAPLLGAELRPAVVMGVGAMVVFLNLACVFGFLLWAPQAGGFSLTKVAKGLLSNPLVLGSAVGLSLAAADLSPPFGLDRFIALLGSAAPPVGVMIAGAALAGAPLATAAAPRLLIGSALAKLVAMPALGAAIAYGLGLEPGLIAVVALLNAMPAAPASYMLAQALGGDSALMARIIAWQTCAAALLLPAALLLASAFAPAFAQGG